MNNNTEMERILDRIPAAAGEHRVLYYVRDALAVLRRGVDSVREEPLLITALHEIDTQLRPVMLKEYPFCLIVRKLIHRKHGESRPLLSLKEIHGTKLASFDAVCNPRYSLSMLYIGPHVSISGSVSLAPGRAHDLGATGFGMFTKNQRVWSAPKLEDSTAESFQEALAASGIPKDAILPHAGYLINPATPDRELRDKSLALFMDEAERTVRLGLSVLNIHPGAYKEGSREDGMRRSAWMLDQVLSAFPSLRIAIENTAGAGTILGSSFEELDGIISESSCKDRIGITLDTAHLFGAGYDVRNDIQGIMDSFFSRFGREKLYGMHLNDSKVPLSSRKDRHESLGKGLIGLEPFIEIVRMDEVQGLPLVLETPDETAWAEEIRTLLEA